MAEIGGELVVLDDLRSIAVGAASDGWDATSGTTGDAAYTGSGSGSKIAVLKGIYAAIKAGTGGGPVTEADGANVTLGSKADAAYTGSGAGTGIALLKGLYALLTGQLSIKGASASFVAGAYADGAITTLGSTTDAPLAAAASGTASSQASVLKGLFNLFFNGTARVGLNATAVQASTGASLAANSQVGSPAIQCGASIASLGYATIKATVQNPPSAGTGQGQYSNDSQNWGNIGSSVPCPANIVTHMTFDVVAPYMRVLYTNGSTALSTSVPIFVQASAV